MVGEKGRRKGCCYCCCGMMKEEEEVRFKAEMFRMIRNNVLPLEVAVIPALSPYALP